MSNAEVRSALQSGNESEKVFWIARIRTPLDASVAGEVGDRALRTAVRGHAQKEIECRRLTFGVEAGPDGAVTSRSSIELDEDAFRRRSATLGGGAAPIDGAGALDSPPRPCPS